MSSVTPDDAPIVVQINAPIDAHGLDELRSLSPRLRIRDHSPASGALPTGAWHDVDVLFTSFAAPLPTPQEAPRLRWVQYYSAGVERVIDHPLAAAGVIFTTTSGIHATPIAEYVIAWVLAWYRRVPLLLGWQREAHWPTRAEREGLDQRELRGATLGIVGYGSVGREMARLANAFGMRVLATSHGGDHRDQGYQLAGNGDAEGTLPERYYPLPELHELLRASDIVLIALPSTPDTRGLFDAAAFAAMKPSALLVNIARGDISDEAALLDALTTRRIAGAVLDVFVQEPLPADSPLWHLPNVIITPHISALTPAYADRAAALFTENLHRYLAGQPLLNVVNRERGY